MLKLTLKVLVDSLLSQGQKQLQLCSICIGELNIQPMNTQKEHPAEVLIQLQ